MRCIHSKTIVYVYVCVCLSQVCWIFPRVHSGWDDWPSSQPWTYCVLYLSTMCVQTRCFCKFTKLHLLVQLPLQSFDLKVLSLDFVLGRPKEGSNISFQSLVFFLQLFDLLLQFLELFGMHRSKCTSGAGSGDG